MVGQRHQSEESEESEESEDDWLEPELDVPLVQLEYNYLKETQAERTERELIGLMTVDVATFPYYNNYFRGDLPRSESYRGAFVSHTLIDLPAQGPTSFPARKAAYRAWISQILLDLPAKGERVNVPANKAAYQAWVLKGALHCIQHYEYNIESLREAIEMATSRRPVDGSKALVRRPFQKTRQSPGPAWEWDVGAPDPPHLFLLALVDRMTTLSPGSCRLAVDSIRDITQLFTNTFRDFMSIDAAAFDDSRQAWVEYGVPPIVPLPESIVELAQRIETYQTWTGPPTRPVLPAVISPVDANASSPFWDLLVAPSSSSILLTDSQVELDGITELARIVAVHKLFDEEGKDDDYSDDSNDDGDDAESDDTKSDDDEGDDDVTDDGDGVNDNDRGGGRGWEPERELGLSKDDENLEKYEGHGNHEDDETREGSDDDEDDDSDSSSSLPSEATYQQSRPQPKWGEFGPPLSEILAPIELKRQRAVGLAASREETKAPPAINRAGIRKRLSEQRVYLRLEGEVSEVRIRAIEYEYATGIRAL